MGPVILSARRMMNDVLIWAFLLGWLILTFSSFFRALYAEPYGLASNLPAGCIDPDVEFENIMFVAKTLFEGTLIGGDGHFTCLSHSSTSFLALPMMYLFLICAVIILVNMLIAMMAKTFDKVVDTQTELFLYLKAQQVTTWMRYSPLPPPLNLLRFPYIFIVLPIRVLWRGFASLRRGLPSSVSNVAADVTAVPATLHHKVSRLRFDTTETPPFELPPWWVSAHDVDSIVESVLDFGSTDDEKHTRLYETQMRQHTLLFEELDTRISEAVSHSHSQAAGEMAAQIAAALKGEMAASPRARATVHGSPMTHRPSPTSPKSGRPAPANDLRPPRQPVASGSRRVPSPPPDERTDCGASFPRGAKLTAAAVVEHSSTRCGAAPSAASTPSPSPTPSASLAATGVVGHQRKRMAIHLQSLLSSARPASSRYAAGDSPLSSQEGSAFALPAGRMPRPRSAAALAVSRVAPTIRRHLASRQNGSAVAPEPPEPAPAADLRATASPSPSLQHTEQLVDEIASEPLDAASVGERLNVAQPVRDHSDENLGLGTAQDVTSPAPACALACAVSRTPDGPADDLGHGATRDVSLSAAAACTPAFTPACTPACAVKHAPDGPEGNLGHHANRDATLPAAAACAPACAVSHAPDGPADYLGHGASRDVSSPAPACELRCGHSTDRPGERCDVTHSTIEQFEVKQPSSPPSPKPSGPAASQPVVMTRSGSGRAVEELQLAQAQQRTAEENEELDSIEDLRHKQKIKQHALPPETPDVVPSAAVDGPPGRQPNQPPWKVPHERELLDSVFPSW